MSDRDAEYLEYVTAHRGRMLRTARLLTAGDTHWAEDLVQVALTRLYVHWSKVRREDGAARFPKRACCAANPCWSPRRSPRCRAAMSP